MGEPVEEGGGESGVVVEHRRPVGELQVGCEDETTTCVSVGEQDEEQLRLVGIQPEE
jgi:hypothetical protein